MAKVLLVEDDLALSDNITEWLKLEHYVVESVTDGLDGLDRLRFYKYDVIILDWMLPGLEGVEICRKFRTLGGTTPILMLTGKDQISEKEIGLDSGSDDYLTKPFHMKELSARLRALLRRLPSISSNLLKCGGLELNLQEHTVSKNGQTIELYPREFSLLEFFMRHPNQLFSTDALLDRVWNSCSDVSTESVRTYVARVRSKIDDENCESLIQNMRGAGYKFVSKHTSKEEVE